MLSRNVPIGIGVMLAVLLFVPKCQGNTQSYNDLSLSSKLNHMDPIGTVLFIGAVCSLLLVLTWGGQTYSWSNSRIIGLLVGFGLMVCCFCYWLWKRGDLAIIPLRILQKRSICMGALILFAIGILSQVVRTDCPSNLHGFNELTKLLHSTPITFQFSSSLLKVSRLQTVVSFISDLSSPKL
jgi:hypothetical protein